MESVATIEFLEATAAARGAEAVRLSSLRAGSRATVVAVVTEHGTLSALERRLLELGFVNGEQIEIIAEARPGRDPFVIRVGSTTLALRRREVQSVWVSPLAARS